MAGAGKKTFTAGETLTASDVNTYLMEQSVMVFGGTAARSSAIPTPSDGMVTYNQTNNALEAYNGSEWINKSGLQLVKKQTILSAVTSVTVTNAFSATYENYKIMISGGTGSNTDLNLRIGASTSAYFAAYSGAVFSTGANSSASDNGTTSFTRIGHARSDSLQCDVDLRSPFLAKFTYMNSSFVGATTGLSGNGVHAVATSYTDFTIISAGALTGGTIYVYGYGT
jgi:hypothetical protein